jgi:hypothetical protein
MRTRRTSPIAVAATLAIAVGNSPAAGAAKVDYGPISHASKYGASSYKRNAVVNAFKGQGVGGSCCPARPGYDLATGWGSPLANTVAGLLGARG